MKPNFFAKVLGLLLKKKTWIVIACLSLLYGWTWFWVNFYFQNPIESVKWRCFLCQRYPTSENRKTHQEGGKELKISTHSASLVTVVEAKEPTSKIVPHKKFLTQQQYENQQYTRKYVEAFYDADEVQAFDNVILSEGWYQTDIKNPESGACGIGQALPCEKMGCPLDQSGLDCQIEWTMKYVKNRYGNPIKAWEFRQANGWY